jgi:hypothetical protein
VRYVGCTCPRSTPNWCVVFRAFAACEPERASVAAKSRQAEKDASIRYVAELIGADTDSEKAIRWLIALMVLCCDPLAIALTAAASARRSTV